MTIFHFQTHISSDGEFALPPIPEALRGDDVVITIESVAKKEEKPRRKLPFEERCGIWDTEDRREDTERMAQAIHEGRSSDRAEIDWPNPTDEQLEKMYDLCHDCLEGMTKEEYDRMREERILGKKR